MFSSDSLEACPHQSYSQSHGSYSLSQDSYDSDSSSDVKKKVTIPKLIMQTWKNKDIPKKWAISPKSIKKYMPDWEYVLMTDKDNRKFVKKHFPDFLPYYDGFTHNIQRADAIRYMYLYVNGGIYMDLDFEVQHSLDDLFVSDSEVYLVSSGNIGSYITNSFMASKPGCRLWLEMIEAMKKPLPWYYLGKHIEVMCSTGPVMLNHVVKNSTVVYSVLPPKLIMPCSVCESCCKAEGAYLRPLEGSSWVTYDTKFYNFFLCKWRKLLVVLGILLFILLIVFMIYWLGYI
jgi:mannosyltransferase OCH1-like enzyme